MMRFLISAAAISVLAAPAWAGDAEVLAQCEGFVAEHGGDSGVCGCFADLAADDADLKAALLAIETPEDNENAPEIVGEAAAVCGADGAGG
ncbi:MAG: hypothetical protein AAGL49_05510 [Pseudomonadota bacterium]